MNAPTFSRICAQSGSSLGSKTTHCGAAIEAFFDEQGQAADRDVFVFVGQLVGAAQRARAPDHAPGTGKARRQLMPSGFSMPFSASFRLTCKPWTPLIVASRPAGAFHTPRLGIGARHDAGDDAAGHEGVRAARRASGRFVCTRGKYSAALRASVPVKPSVIRSVAGRGRGGVLVGTPGRRWIDNEHGATIGAVFHRRTDRLLGVYHPPARRAGCTDRLNRSAFSSAYRPVF